MIVTLSLAGTCPCGHPLRGVLVAEATVRIRSLRLQPTMGGFGWCDGADRNHPAGHGTPVDVQATLTADSAATVERRREALRERGRRRRAAA